MRQAHTPLPSLPVNGGWPHPSPHIAPPAPPPGPATGPGGREAAGRAQDRRGALLPGLPSSAPTESALAKGAGVSHLHSSQKLALAPFPEPPEVETFSCPKPMPPLWLQSVPPHLCGASLSVWWGPSLLSALMSTLSRAQRLTIASSRSEPLVHLPLRAPGQVLGTWRCPKAAHASQSSCLMGHRQVTKRL